jgi:hypothetical protein
MDIFKKEGNKMEDTLYSVFENIMWVNEMNSNVLAGQYHKIEFLKRNDPNEIETLEKLTREQLYNIISNYGIVFENIRDDVKEKLELD